VRLENLGVCKAETGNPRVCKTVSGKPGVYKAELTGIPGFARLRLGNRGCARLWLETL